MSKQFSAMIAAIGALLAPGCGSTEGGAANDDAPVALSADPCSYATKEEVGAILGETVASTSTRSDSCVYSTKDAQASSLTVTVLPVGGAAEMEMLRAAAGVLGNIGSEVDVKKGPSSDVAALLAPGGPLEGLGDEAFIDMNRQLNVLKGDTLVSISPPMMRTRLSGGNPLLPAKEKDRMAADVARIVLKRLG